MKIALVQCPVWGTREPPLALVQLSALLKNKGFETKAFDMNIYLYRNRTEDIINLWAWEQSMFWYSKVKVKRFFTEQDNLITEFMESIFKFGPDIIGFSIESSTYWSSCQFAKLIKNKKRNLKIIFGGQGFYNMDYIRTAFIDAPVDFIIRGEGEIPFVDLLQSLDLKKGIKNCRGVYFKDNSRFVFKGEGEVLKNLDKLPYMDFTDVKIDDYDDNEHISIMASRGCIWKCAFCSSKSFWKGYRWMSGERIHQEINYQRTINQALGHIDFADLVFNGNIQRVIEFAELMIKYPPYDPKFKIEWVANGIISPTLTSETLALMKEGGCQRLIFGIESGSSKVLKLMKKNYEPKVAKRVIRDAYEAGIKVTTNFMFGFPGETKVDFQETLDFIKEIGPFIERAYPSRTYCALEEYSDLYHQPEKFGVKTPVNHHLYWEDISGKNKYPVRLERCRRFEEFCHDLGIKTDRGVKTTIRLDNWYNLAMYYEHIRDYEKALEYYHKYLSRDPKSEDILDKVKKLLNENNISGEIESKLNGFLIK